MHFRHILHILDKDEKNNQHISGETLESHPSVQDFQHPRLAKPRLRLQILDTRMGFPHPSLNVVIDSINLLLYVYHKVNSIEQVKIVAVVMF